MRIAVLTAGLALTLGAGAALAEPRILLMQDATPTEPPAAKAEPAPAKPPVPAARFSFERSNDGFLRMDTQTGQVAFCAPRSAGWTCEAVLEERTALELEIGRLQDEVADLKRELAELHEPPPPPRPPADLAPRPPGKEGDAVIKLPSQEDIDRATAALQRAWDRVVDMISNFKKDLLKKDLSRTSQPDRTTL